MHAPTDTLTVLRPFRFDGVEYAHGDRFRPDMADANVVRKVAGLKRRRYVDIWTRTRRKEASSGS